MKKFLVDLHWDLAKQYEIEAETEDEAYEKMNAILNSGEVNVYTDGFETTDDTNIEVVGEIDKNGRLTRMVTRNTTTNCQSLKIC